MNKSKWPYQRRAYKSRPIELQHWTTQILQAVQTKFLCDPDFTEESYQRRTLSMLAVLASSKDKFLSMSDRQLTAYRKTVRPGYGWNEKIGQYYKIEKVK
jgi:hypothetical protein